MPKNKYFLKKKNKNLKGTKQQWIDLSRNVFKVNYRNMEKRDRKKGWIGGVKDTVKAKGGGWRMRA